jgi:hypothetical protein
MPKEMLPIVDKPLIQYGVVSGDQRPVSPAGTCAGLVSDAQHYYCNVAVTEGMTGIFQIARVNAGICRKYKTAGRMALLTPPS